LRLYRLWRTILKHMGNEAISGQTLASECTVQSPEVSAYASIDNAALIVKFYEMGADPDIGRELSARLLAHAGYTGDPAAEPLVGKDGKQVQNTETGTPLTLADYVNFATEHHFYALERILNFLYTTPGEPEYIEGRAAYAGYVDANRRQVGKGLMH